MHALLRAAALIVIASCSAHSVALAQESATADTLARARALSDFGDFEAVAALLEEYVASHPGTSEAQLLLAQHQYWSGDVAAARASFAHGVKRHPENASLRLAYARFLAENGDVREAREVVLPLAGRHADAEALLGTLAWWRGDTNRARRHFRRALSADPSQAEAAAALASIEAASRPWVRLAGRNGADSQPVNSTGAGVEGGFFLTPLQTLQVNGFSTRYEASAAVVPITTASLQFREYRPSLRLDSEVAAGVVARPDETDWTGRAAAHVRVPLGVRAGGSVERQAYLYTEAAILEAVSLVGAQADLALDTHGWLGEAGARREWYPDENTKDVFFAWLLAPLVRKNVVSLRAGYAFGYENAAESRFVPVLAGRPGPGRPADWQGRYTPYYTPLHRHTHSVTASLTVGPLERVSLSARGAYAFAGAEDAPYVYLVGQGRVPATGVYASRIHPWDLAGSLSVEIARSWVLQVQVAHMEHTWYDATTTSLALLGRF